MPGLSEADWEHATLEYLAEPLGWRPVHGSTIAPGSGERESWADLVIRSRLLQAVRELNPTVPDEYLQQAVAEIVQPRSQDAITENHRVHDILVDGHRLSYIDHTGYEVTPTIRVVSSDPDENDWLVANQVVLRDREHDRRLDVVLYLNGMPISVIELKRAGSETAAVAGAHAQLQTYLREFPAAFRFCAFVVATDGVIAEYGTPFTPLNHFSPWNVDDDGIPVASGADNEMGAQNPLEVALHGLFTQDRLPQLLRSFIAFDEGDDGLTKRIAKPHQYFAVNKAVGATVQAVESNGKAGVVWHTQGSGKSMEMELYAALVGRHPRLKNPTIVVVTDRTELDGQLFDTFDHSLLLPEKPVQITSRAALRQALTATTTGGVLFTTLQKFGLSKKEREASPDHPLLSDRRNVVVVVDEAHRSHYDDLDGYAKYLRQALPFATLIAFTGTPISFADRNTRDVFGGYIDIYDLTRAVDEGATVPVAFEPRLIKVALAEGVTQQALDDAADEATVGLDDVERARLEASVAVINAVYGAPERIDALARDIVEHWTERRRRMVPFIESPGKAMIVGATRQICADLYAAIVALEPSWHDDAVDKGRIKVVYSGVPSDLSPIVDHVRRPSQNKAIKERLRDEDDDLEIVIVKDMMLTGFDSPPLHTLYLDRPLKGALLMQTLARVNRTFRGKQDGLLVAYAPLVENLTSALNEYTQADKATRPVGRGVDEAAALALEIVLEIRSLVEGSGWQEVRARGGRLAYANAALRAVSHLRDPARQVVDGDTDGAPRQVRYRQRASQLARAWALASGRQTLSEVADEIGFYEEVRVYMAKLDAQERKASGEPVPDDIERLLSQLVAESTVSGEVLDIYEAAGLPRPTLTDLTPDFVQQAEESSTAHLAIEALRALLAQEASVNTQGNSVRSRAFSERLTELMARYTNQQLTAAAVIAELVAFAHEVAAEGSRGDAFAPPLNRDELAFYDAVAQNESAVAVQGEGVLADIARSLVDVMRRDVRTDWTVRDDVRAKLRSSIKRLLVRHGYPPDKQPEAIKLVLEQMEAMALRFAADREAS